jgi:hypothetical protein
MYDDGELREIEFEMNEVGRWWCACLSGRDAAALVPESEQLAVTRLVSRAVAAGKKRQSIRDVALSR